MRKNYLLIFIASALFFNCTSLYKKDYNKGVKQTENLNYFLGIDYFLKSWERAATPESARALAQAYYHTRNFEQAEEWYNRLNRDNDLQQEDLVQYAEVLIANSKYNEAKQVLDQKEDQADVRWETLMKTALSGTSLLNKNSIYAVGAIAEVNTQYDEIGPFLLDNETLIFVSDRIDKAIKNVNATNALKSDMYGWTGNSFLTIYETSWDAQEGKVKGEVSHNADFQSKLHIGPIFISEELEFATITQNQKFQKSSKASSARNFTLYPEIFFRERGGDSSAFKPLPFNSPFLYAVSDPFYHASSKRLYFSSDMEGGFGGADLYYSKYKGDGEWGDPVNLGDVINTSGSERSPFWSKEGKFYFSSDGHIGLGGLDIYVSNYANNRLGHPENLGSPINSNRDDFGFIKTHDDSNIMFFSSDRSGGKGLDDIYMAREKQIDISLNGKVYDRVSNQLLEDAIVSLTDKAGSSLGSFITGKDGSFNFRVEPDQKINISARKTEYMAADPVQVLVPALDNLADTLMQQNLYLDKIEVGRVYQIENIYYDFDKWNLRADAKTELDKLVKILADNPTIKIELYSHTDARGDDSYNLTLSNKRAESVVSYLESKGISSSRMKAVGFGETQLVNACDNTTPCSEEQHQENRRTEFKVVEY